MRTNSLLPRLLIGAYLVVFFGYLLGPLIVMSITAFNSPSFPKMTPWECLTFEWFDVLARDERILTGIENSLIVGVGTVILSVIMGLSGALMLTQIWPKLRATYYTIVIAPILIPGVVLGISTLVFWDRISIMLGMSTGGILHNGIFLTILGQSTFIASYCMLVFIARLQRFDTGLTEAALDLGATPVQAFRKILLPFMKPAIGSAAVLAFLASFENYNTTTFTFGKFPTLTIELAQKVRYGINPSISALAFIIIVLTIIGALIHEIYRRRQQLALANGAPVAAVSGGFQLPKIFRGNPAAIILVLLALGGASTIWFSQSYSPGVCKMDVREQKRLIQEERIKEIRAKRQLELQQKQLKSPDSSGDIKSDAPVTQSPGKGAFGNVFDPGNLDKAAPKSETEKPAESPGKGAFGDVFAPKNLDKATPKDD
ncbi:ABC transporter permease [Sneathiella litorea]|uniref:ABC transporter permease subunit n=1 Tax=Sneathiella litorea TaxID=2606216 RepID=A0A6L8W6S2_9PROT|nr:ABC transporter permease [Sneathiella litorea]MZR30090.1 ABC transporter permease subunit [Sneathiella litorea]